MNVCVKTTSIDDLIGIEAAVHDHVVPTQISARAPKGKIIEVNFGKSAVTYADVDADYTEMGVLSATHICLSWVLESDASQIVGRHAMRGDFAVHPPGAVHSARHNGRLSYATITVEANRLWKLAQFEGIELDKSLLSRTGLYRPAPQWAEFSSRYVQKTVDVLDNLPKLTFDRRDALEKVRMQLVDDLSRLFLHSLGQADLSGAKADRNTLLGQRVVRAVQERFAKGAEDKPDMSDLLGMTHVSIRTLQRAVQSYTGVSLARYFTLYRLSRAHVDLCHGSKQNMQVGLVAHKWGFQHAGRFAIEYRKIFGESPLKTLSRQPIC